MLKRVVAVREKVVGAGHRDLIPAVEALADLYARQGRLAVAEPVYQRALALREANHADSLKQAEEQEKVAAMIRHMMAAEGASVSATGSVLSRTAEVQRLETRALVLREASAESIAAAVTTEGYSALLRRTGRPDEAEALEARAKAIRDAAETRSARARAAGGR